MLILQHIGGAFDLFDWVWIWRFFHLFLFLNMFPWTNLPEMFLCWGCQAIPSLSSISRFVAGEAPAESLKTWKSSYTSHDRYAMY